jgi:acetylornithine deacetylase/succinyl-diaminopimelate desuccinylase-like protein
MTHPGPGQTTLSQALEAAGAEAATHLSRLRDWIRQPSCTGDPEQVRQFAGYVTDDLTEHGWQVEHIDIGVDEPHPPFILARLYPEADRTLLLYSHYDVVPVEPLADWQYPPFGAEQEGDRIYGRGSSDAKGNVLALAIAAETLTRLQGRPPCGIALILEGEEESGSKHLPDAIAALRQRLRPDAALSFDGGMHASGVPKIGFGTSGMALIELTCRNGGGDLHAASGRIIPNPAWKLVWALAAIKDAAERVLVPGFDADIIPPTAGDRELMDAMPWNDEALLAEAGVPAFVAGLSGRAALERLLYSPGLTICGFSSGYVGAASKAVIPNQATARLEIRIVQGQTPERVLGQIRRHLDSSGLADVSLELLSSVVTAQSDPFSEIAAAVIDSARQLYGGAVVKPTEEYAGLQGAWLGQEFGIPGVQTGVGPVRFNGHAANEFITEQAFVTGIRYAASIMVRYGAAAPARAAAESQPATGAA